MWSFVTKKGDTPTVLQMEAVECGAASLAMILEYHGQYVPLERLRVTCGVSRDGSKASNILRAARSFGLIAKGYKKEPEALLGMELPFIVFWNFNHFIVVEGFDKKGYVFINDPARGKRTLAWDDFDKGFTGVVLTFEKTDEFKTGSKRPSILPGLIRRLKGSISPLMIAVTAGVLMTIPGLMVPIFSKVYIDDYLIKGMHDWVFPLILVMIATLFVNAGLNVLQRHYLLKMQSLISVSESSKFFWHIIRLPMDFFNQRMAGEIGSRISLNNNVASAITGQLATSIIGMISIVFYAMLMFYYDAVLTLIGIASVILNFIIFKKIIESMTVKSQKIALAQGRLIGVSMGGLQSIETLKASANEDDFFVKWSGTQAKMQNARNDMVMLNQAVSIIPTLFSSINIVLILIIGSFRVMDGYLTMGMLVAFQSLMYGFTAPVNNLLSLSASIKSLEGDMNRLDDVLKYPIEEDAKVNTKDTITTNAKLNGYVELKNLSFGYSELEAPLIENFSLTVKPGERVALIGGSGSGKSTVAKLVT
ncbi:MAG: ATP-binding cassette domain-containing protein, partial [Bacteroidales bacterium]|nr:ATP-binding cassette domain-containing protein [Bacteroidales bacterium]